MKAYVARAGCLPWLRSKYSSTCMRSEGSGGVFARIVKAISDVSDLLTPKKSCKRRAKNGSDFRPITLRNTATGTWV